MNVNGDIVNLILNRDIEIGMRWKGANNFFSGKLVKKNVGVVTLTAPQSFRPVEGLGPSDP